MVCNIFEETTPNLVYAYSVHHVYLQPTYNLMFEHFKTEFQLNFEFIFDVKLSRTR